MEIFKISVVCLSLANKLFVVPSTHHKAPITVKNTSISTWKTPIKLSDKTRTTRTPEFWGYHCHPNDYPYHLCILDPMSKQDKVKGNGSGEDCWRADTILSTDKQMDGRTDKVKPVYPLSNSLKWGYNNIHCKLRQPIKNKDFITTNNGQYHRTKSYHSLKWR